MKEMAALLAAATLAPRCGILLYGHSYAENLPGKPLTYAESAAACCQFCHDTAGCIYWTS